MADTLPHELTIDILSRLPVKSILRFRCVCKHWCNLMFDSNFIKLHLSRAIQRDARDFVATKPEVIAKYTGMGTIMFGANFINWIDGSSFKRVLKINNPLDESVVFYGSSKLVGSCNGVVCLVKKNRVCLLNPCTREYKIVSFDNNTDFSHDAVYGFGYDAVKDDYLLVQIIYTEDGGESEVSVYSLNDSSRKQISDFPYRIGVDERQSGMFLNGAIYWVARKKYEHAERLIAFEVGVKEFHEIPRPNVILKNADFDEMCLDFPTCLTVGVIDGILALLTICNIYIDIWKLKNDDANGLWGEVLSIETSIDDGEVPWSSSYSRRPVKPLYFSKNGEVVIIDKGNIVMIDLEEGQETYLDSNGLPDLDKLVIHCPSLVSLRSGSYIETMVGTEAEE